MQKKKFLTSSPPSKSLDKILLGYNAREEASLNTQGREGKVFSLPNALSLFRIIATPFFLYFSYTGNIHTAQFLFFLAVLSDWADGFIARTFQQESRLGEMLDPIADKILLMASFVGFFLMGKIPFSIMLIAVGRDILLLFAGSVILLKHYNFKMQPARLSKWNTLLQMCFIALVAFPLLPESFALFLGYICSLTALLSGALYAHVFIMWWRLGKECA